MIVESVTSFIQVRELLSERAVVLVSVGWTECVKEID